MTVGQPSLYIDPNFGLAFFSLLHKNFAAKKSSQKKKNLQKRRVQCSTGKPSDHHLTDCSLFYIPKKVLPSSRLGGLISKAVTTD